LPALQCVAQAFPAHVEYPPGQEPGVTVPQLPLPSHRAAGVSIPLLQLALAHWVVLEATSHIPLEPQVPVLPQVPLGVQALLQQMPPTQWLFVHCEDMVQGLPSGAGAQVWVPVSQLSFAQSLFWMQATQVPFWQTLPPLLQVMPSVTGV
jgi:hypothetical protein